MPFSDHILKRPSYRWQNAAISSYQDYKEYSSYARYYYPYLQSGMPTRIKANLTIESVI